MDYSKQMWKDRLAELSSNLKWHSENPGEIEIIWNVKFNDKHI